MKNTDIPINVPLTVRHAKTLQRLIRSEISVQQNHRPWPGTYAYRKIEDLEDIHAYIKPLLEKVVQTPSGDYARVTDNGDGTATLTIRVNRKTKTHVLYHNSEDGWSAVGAANEVIYALTGLNVQAWNGQATPTTTTRLARDPINMD